MIGRWCRRAALGLAVFAPIATAAQAADWLTYGYDTTRQAFNPAERTLSASTASGLVSAWTFNASKFDLGLKIGLDPSPVIEAQPVLASGLSAGGKMYDFLFFGDTNGVFFALDAKTGAVRWHRQLGHVKNNCNDFPGGLYGIIGSAVIDRTANKGRGAVYVATDAGTTTSATTSVHAFDLVSGTELTGWPIAIPDINATKEGYVYGGLTLYNHQLYVGTAAACQEGNYHGQVSLIDTAQNKFIRHWWTMTGSQTLPTLLGGPVWGPGGVTIDPHDAIPGIYIGTGNSLPYGSGNEQRPYAEAIVKVSLDLTRTLDSIAPAFSQYGDEDFGSSPSLVKPPTADCGGKTLAVAINKIGALYGFDEDSLSHSSHSIALQISGRNGYFLGDVAYDATKNILVVDNPTGRPGAPAGVLGFQFNSSCIPTLIWTQNKTTNGDVLVDQNNYVSPPTIANGVVYIGTGGVYGPPTSAPPSRIVAINEMTGQTLWSAEIPGGALSAPMVVNGMLFEGGFDHIMHAYKLP